MGNTHTKLLAGAFSVLSVMQFFMVYDLNNQVNDFTVTAALSSDNVRPSIMRVRLKNLKSAAPAHDLSDRRVQRLPEGTDLTKIFQTRSFGVIPETSPTPNTNTMRKVMVPGVKDPVHNFRPMATSGVTPAAEPTAVQAQ